MFDLLALAYQADLTRVASYIMVAEGTNRTYNHIGVPDSFHPVSHHANDIERHQQAGQDPDLARGASSRNLSPRWRPRRTARDRLLDHSIFMYGSNMSNSDLHNNYPEPNIVVGGGNGKMKLGGQHIVLPERTPIANLHLTLLQKAGIERDKFGDSTGIDCGRLGVQLDRREFLKGAAGGAARAVGIAARLSGSTTARTRRLTDKLAVIDGGGSNVLAFSSG